MRCPGHCGRTPLDELAEELATAREIEPADGISDHPRHLRAPGAHQAAERRRESLKPRRPREPGWYESRHGGKRYWDGKWTNHRRRRRPPRIKRWRLAGKGRLIVVVMALAALIVSVVGTARPDNRARPYETTSSGQHLHDESPRRGRFNEPVNAESGRRRSDPHTNQGPRSSRSPSRQAAGELGGESLCRAGAEGDESWSRPPGNIRRKPQRDYDTAQPSAGSGPRECRRKVQGSLRLRPHPDRPRLHEDSLLCV